MRIQVGFVVRAHGVRGAVRVRASENFINAKTVFVDDQPRRVLECAPERSEYLVRLEGVVDRDQADALKGAKIEIERDELPQASDQEVYIADLIGCDVLSTAGEALGKVRESFPSGPHEILVVTDGTRQFMLPFVDGIVVEVDVAGRRIVCDPPEGLIDLDKADA